MRVVGPAWHSRSQILAGALSIGLTLGCADPGAAPSDDPPAGGLSPRGLQDVMAALEQGSWIDLTYSYNSDTPYWPTAREFEKTTIFEGRTDGGWYYTAYDITTSEHGGTHLDAPIHFAEGKYTSDQIPIERLVGPGAVINVSDKTTGQPDYEVTVDDLKRWEAAHGEIPSGAIVLLRTGWGAFYPDRKTYLGTDARGESAVADLHFPGLSIEAARFLATDRQVDAVGIDTPSIDRGQSKDFGSHRALYQHNIPGFENVANLQELPATGSVVIALPMKIEGGSGGPLRIVVWVPSIPETTPGSGC